MQKKVTVVEKEKELAAQPGAENAQANQQKQVKKKTL